MKKGAPSSPTSIAAGSACFARPAPSLSSLPASACCASPFFPASPPPEASLDDFFSPPFSAFCCFSPSAKPSVCWPCTPPGAGCSPSSALRSSVARLVSSWAASATQWSGRPRTTHSRARLHTRSVGGRWLKSRLWRTRVLICALVMKHMPQKQLTLGNSKQKRAHKTAQIEGVMHCVGEAALQLQRWPQEQLYRAACSPEYRETD
eukprot:scaffold125856_cov18-Tisochrysis_lutea.AAC.2